MVALTAWAVKGSPLWNFTPGRSVNSHVVSLTTFQPVASIGLGVSVLGVTIEETIVDVLEHVVGRPVHDGGSEHGARLRPEADHDLLGAGAVLGVRARREGEGQRQHDEDLHGSHGRLRTVRL
jgi:hypothetical protein